MPNVIRQSVTLPASAQRLFAMYLDRRAHAAITGAPVKIGARPGSKFSAFDGALSGEILAVVPGRSIVQSWRSKNFRKSDADSTLVLTFTPLGRNRARIDLVQVGVPAQDFAGVREGWPAYYWKPWRRFLTKAKR